MLLYQRRREDRRCWDKTGINFDRLANTDYDRVQHIIARMRVFDTKI